MNEYKKNNHSELIKSILFLIWFISSLIMMVIGGAIDINYSMIAFGQYFVVFGIIAYSNSRVKLAPLLFIIVGSVIVVGSILNILKIYIDWDFLAPILLFVGAIMTGLTLVFTTILDINLRKKRCTVSVNATIVNYSYVYDNDEYNGRRKLYSPIYGFNYNNKYYEVIFPYFSNFTKLKSKGNVINIKINPDNPYEIYLISNVVKYMIYLGILIVLGFVFAFLYYIKTDILS